MAIQMLPGELVSALVKVLKLPKRTVWFELRCAINEVVAVKCEYYPDVDSVMELESITKTYRLEEIVDDENGTANGGA